jgi:hypothetical protein
LEPSAKAVLSTITSVTNFARQKVFNRRNSAADLPTRPVVSICCTVHCRCAKVAHDEAGFDAEEQAMEDQERRTFLRKSGLAVTAGEIRELCWLFCGRAPLRLDGSKFDEYPLRFAL